MYQHLSFTFLSGTCYGFGFERDFSNHLKAFETVWKERFSFIHLSSFNSLTPMSDHERISPYNINTLSSRQVVRKKKNIN